MNNNFHPELWQLLRCSLWGKFVDVELPSGKMVEILRCANQQTVYGLIFDALSKIDSLRKHADFFEQLSLYLQIQMENERLNKKVIELARLCEQEGIEYKVIKGQTLGSLYRIPNIRTPGDIDFIVNEEYFKIKGIFETHFKVQLPCRRMAEISFVSDEVEYELHYILRAFAKKKNQEYWDELMRKEWDQVAIVPTDGVEIRTLSPTFSAVFVFLHLFFHFIREGVSLRQLCDWAMVLHYYKDEIDKTALKKHISNMDMLQPYKAFGSILVENIGLPENEFPFEISIADKKWKEIIIKDIISGGNFGQLYHSARNPLLYKIETMGISVRNSFKYYSLCPSEIGGLVPRLVKGNLKSWFS